jgi:hypothetical protein
MLKNCSHGQTAYSIAGWLADGSYYCAEVCACGSLRIFRIALPGADRPIAASVSLLPKERRDFGSFPVQQTEKV